MKGAADLAGTSSRRTSDSRKSSAAATLSGFSNEKVLCGLSICDARECRGSSDVPTVPE